MTQASPRRPPAAGLVATPAAVVAALTDAVAPRGPPLSTLAAQPAPPGEGDPFAKALRLAAKHLHRWQAAAAEHATDADPTPPLPPSPPVRLRQGPASPPLQSKTVGPADVPGLLRSVALLPLMAAQGAPHRAPMATVALVRALLAAASTAACFLAATGPPAREGTPSPSIATLCQLCCRAQLALSTVLKEAMLSANCPRVLDVLPPSRLLSLLMAITKTTVAAASIAALPCARAIAACCAEGSAAVVYWLVWGAGGGQMLHSELSGAKVVEMVLEAPLVALEDDQVGDRIMHRIPILGYTEYTTTMPCEMLVCLLFRMQVMCWLMGCGSCRGLRVPAQWQGPCVPHMPAARMLPWRALQLHWRLL